MKPRNLGRKLALLTTIVTCGAASTAFSQSMFDIYLLADTTGSMGPTISGVRASSNALVDNFLATGNNVRFGVGEFKDGFVDAFAFRHNLVEDGLPILTTDKAAISTAISQWTASGGGDIPEDNLLALRSVANTTPWRDGARRIVYIFGDAPSLVTGSDGTTIDDALAALSANCVEVVFIDVGGMANGVGQSQIDAILANELKCDQDPGAYVDLNISGLTPEEAAEKILETLTDSFTGLAGTNVDTKAIVISGNLAGSIVTNRTMTRDVGGRLANMRAGMPAPQLTRTQPGTAPAPGPKGGMAKGGTPSPVTMTYDPQWQVWGQLYYSDESQDALYQNTGLTAAPRRMVRADTDIEVFGGTVGVERRLDHGFTVGLAFGYAETDVSMSTVGNTDIDTWALMPYISYYRSNAFQGADFYADLLYAYSDNDYDTRRLNGARGSTSGDSNMIEVNAGLNFRSGNIVHGPFGQFRWLDGDIDGYTETGLGALTYDSTDYKSVATQLGYQVSFPMQVQGGVFVPQFSAAWEHEFEEDQGSVGGIPLGPVDEDLAVLGIGLGYYLTNGVSMAVNYEARLGSDTENHYVGLRCGWNF